MTMEERIDEILGKINQMIEDVEGVDFDYFANGTFDRPSYKLSDAKAALLSAFRDEQLALIERIRTDVIGEEESLHKQSDFDKIDVPHPETDREPWVVWVRQASRNLLRSHQSAALNRIKAEVEGKGE